MQTTPLSMHGHTFKQVHRSRCNGVVKKENKNRIPTKFHFSEKKKRWFLTSTSHCRDIHKTRRQKQKTKTTVLSFWSDATDAFRLKHRYIKLRATQITI